VRQLIEAKAMRHDSVVSPAPQSDQSTTARKNRVVCGTSNW
jgi:hypothetical protein